MDAEVREQAIQEISWWGLFWGWVAGLFALFATITNLLHAIFDLKFIPIFENSLEGFRAFSHWILDNLILNWLTQILSSFVYVITFLASKLLPTITPILLEISVPGWYKNVILIAIVVSKALQRAVDVSRPNLSIITDEGLRAQRESLGAIGFLLYRALWIPITILDEIVYIIARTLAIAAYTITRRVDVALLVWNIVRHTLAGATLLSFLVLLQRTIEAFLPAFDDFPAGRYVFWVYATLVAATAASVAFILWNGYALDYIVPRT